MDNKKFMLGVLSLVVCWNHCLTQNVKLCTDCNSNAVCDAKTNYFTCSCKTGFIGNGVNCTEKVICSRSLSCCPSGYRWNTVSMVCDDINECLDPFNMCYPATCTNKIGCYICGSTVGKTCGGIYCPYDQDCVNINGALTCADPCINSKEIDGASRLFSISSTGKFPTDQFNIGWFRFTPGFKMKEGCVGSLKCGSAEPFSISSHPKKEAGVKMVPLTLNTVTGCINGSSIPVKACDGFYVYKFLGTTRQEVYCSDISSETPTTTTTTTPTTTTTTTPTTTTTTTTPTTTTTTTTPTTTTTTTTPTTTTPTTTTPTTTTPTTTTPTTTTPTTTTPTTTTPTTTTTTTTPTTTMPTTTTPTTTTPTTTTPTTTTPTTTTPTTTTPTTAPTTTTPTTTTPTTTTPTTTTPSTTTPTTTTPTTTTPTTTTITTAPTTPTTTTTTTTPTTTTPTTTTPTPTTPATTTTPTTTTTTATSPSPTTTTLPSSPATQSIITPTMSRSESSALLPSLSSLTTNLSIKSSELDINTTGNPPPSTSNKSSTDFTTQSHNSNTSPRTPSSTSSCANISSQPITIPKSYPYPEENITVTHVSSRSILTVRIVTQKNEDIDTKSLEINETTIVNIEVKTITSNNIYTKVTTSVSPTSILIHVAGSAPESSTDRPDTIVTSSETTTPNTEIFQPDSYCSQPAQTKTTTETSSAAGNRCSSIVSATTTTTITTTEEIIVLGPRGFSASCTHY